MSIIKNKSAITHYELRPHSYRADIFILQKEERRGFQFIVISEFGNWDTYWGAPGESINKFLCSLNKDYMQQRFNANKPKFKRFWEIIWLVFIEQIKNEL